MAVTTAATAIKTDYNLQVELAIGGGAAPAAALGVSTFLVSSSL